MLHLGLIVHSATWADSGAYSYTWYDKNQTDFYISSSAELAGVAVLVNTNLTSFEGKTIHLTNDINLAGTEWIPIGTDNNTFKGNFDGQGHSITNMYVDTSNDYNGFWTQLSNVTIQDVTLEGKVTVTKGYTALLAAKVENSNFKNVNVTSQVAFNKDSGFGSTTLSFSYRMGGLAAISNSCDYENVSVDNVFNFTFGNSNGSNCYGKFDLYIGGISGYGTKNSFYKCTAINSYYLDVNGYIASNYYSTSGSNVIYAGGLLGYDGAYTSTEKTKFISCLSRNATFEGYFNCGTYDTTNFNFGGIVGRISSYGTIKNCVAINYDYTVKGHDYSWVASWYHTNSYFGGITAQDTPTTFGGCYSNNDVNKNVSKVQSNSTKENGSTSYSSTQMNTQSFVDEVNFYSKLEFDEENWCLNENNILAIKLEDTPKGIESIELSPGVIELQTGETQTVNAVITPEDADATLSWRSDDESVAQVTPGEAREAIVKGISAGETTIWAETSTGEKASCAVTVTSPAPASISLPSSLTLKYGATAWLTPEIQPENAVTDILWSSSNEAVATVSDEGLVSAVGEGNASITAETTVGGLTASCKVAVTPKPLYFVTELNGGALIVMEMANEPKVINDGEWLTIEDETASYSYLASEVHKFYMDWVNEGNSASDALADRFNGSIKLSQGEILLQGFAPNTEVCVYSLSGILMDRQTIPAEGSLSIQTIAYAPGTYIVKADNNTLKFIKK